MALHAQRQRLEAAQRQKRVERALDGADGVLQEFEAVAELGIAAGDRHAADHVGMAVEIFRGRMHDQIEAVFERALDIGTGKGVVGGGPDAALLGDRRDALEVDQLEQRIGRRLDPDEARVRPDRGFECAGVGEVDIAEVQPHRAPAHALEQSARAAVEVIDGDDMGAVVEAFERSRDRRQAGGEGERGAAAFQIGDAALECHARRIFGAGVVVALVHARALLNVGGGGVDRHHDGAGGRIGCLPRVHAARREVELVLLRHSSLVFRRRHTAIRK